MSHHQTAGQNYNIKAANRYFENVAKFKYLGKTVTNQNLINEDVKSGLNLGNACCHSVQNIFSSLLLSINIKTGIHKNCIFSCGFVWV
jgi:hypothetical protein